MGDGAITRPSLLLRIRDPGDDAAWAQFVEIYTPLIYRYCRTRGLQDADAADLAQETMAAVARAIAGFEYNPERGKFRNWLLTVVQNRLRTFLSRQQRQPALAGETALRLILERDSLERDDPAWQADYYRTLFDWAAGRVRGDFQDSTWQAFWQTTVDERDGQEVADSLGLTVGAVYVAKSRVLARLKEEILRLDANESLPPGD